MYYSDQAVLALGTPVVRPCGNNQPVIPNGYRLVAICDRIIYKVCPDVTDLTEYTEFYNQYYSGAFVSMDLYLIKANNMPKPISV